MNIPEDLLYTKTHEWVKENEDGSITVGLTDYAQDQLGDVVYVGLPGEGDDLTQGDSFADVESVKAVSDVYSPVTGTVREVNEDLQDAPEKINEDPYGSWLVVIENVSEKEDLLDPVAYKELIENEE